MIRDYQFEDVIEIERMVKPYDVERVPVLVDGEVIIADDGSVEEVNVISAYADEDPVNYANKVDHVILEYWKERLLDKWTNEEDYTPAPLPWQGRTYER